MSKIFEKYTDKIQYPDDLKVIRDRLKEIGELDCSDRELEGFWSWFSDEYYDSGWVKPTDISISRFADYLSEMED